MVEHKTKESFCLDSVFVSQFTAIKVKTAGMVWGYVVSVSEFRALARLGAVCVVLA
jgi:hypothetical protein